MLLLLFSSICIEYFFYPLLSVYMCLQVRSECLVGSIWMCLVSFIHSATLCLFIGAFSPHTLKLITIRYVFIAICLFSGCFYSSLFLSSSLALFHYDLMVFCSGMLRFLYLFSVYYRVLLLLPWDLHKAFYRSNSALCNTITSLEYSGFTYALPFTSEFY